MGYCQFLDSILLDETEEKAFNISTILLYASRVQKVKETQVFRTLDNAVSMQVAIKCHCQRNINASVGKEREGKIDEKGRTMIRKQRRKNVLTGSNNRLNDDQQQVSRTLNSHMDIAKDKREGINKTQNLHYNLVFNCIFKTYFEIM